MSICEDVIDEDLGCLLLLAVRPYLEIEVRRSQVPFESANKY